VRLSAIEHGPRDVKAVALTFDDGPGRVTEHVLDVLARHEAAATFNVLGERVAGREGLLRRMFDEGHEIGNHAFRHDRLAGRPLDAYRQLRRTSAAIGDAVGVTPRVFRPPYGSVSRGVVLAARLAGLVTVRWDVDPHDYDTPGAETIERRVARRVKPGSVVLLHDDRRALQQTAVALDAALDQLVERGYRFVTVSELLAISPRRSAIEARAG
jgi:peptidoglycan-N-acetylglucosamine deacetylase